MTLEGARTRLRVAKDREDSDEIIKMWEERIARRLTLPKYAHLKETKSKGKN